MEYETSRLILPTRPQQRRQKEEDEQFEMDMLAPPSVNFRDLEDDKTACVEQSGQRSYLRRFFEDSSLPSKNILVMDSFDDEEDSSVSVPNDNMEDNTTTTTIFSKSHNKQQVASFSNNNKKSAMSLPQHIFTSPNDHKNSPANLISNLFGGSKNDENKLTMRVNTPTIMKDKNKLSSTMADKPNNKKTKNPRLSSKTVSNNWFGGPLNNSNTNPSSSNQQRNILRHKPDDGNTNGIPDFLADDKEVSAILSNLSNSQYLNKTSPNTIIHDHSPTALKSRKISTNHCWYNRLNVSLFISYTLASAATSIPISLVPTIAMDIFSIVSTDNGKTNMNDTSTKISSIIASYAVFGTAMGKFCNGPMGDFFGARRISCMYTLLLCTSLLYLSCSQTETKVYWACAAVEYYQSAQWPCIVVILAAHYKNKENVESFRNGIQQENDNDTYNAETNALYEGGIYITSLGSRIGSLLSTFATTILLRYFQWHWRSITRLGAIMAFISFLVMYKMVTDSPGKLHDPQNPIGGMPHLLRHPNRRQGFLSGTGSRLYHLAAFVYSEILLKNILPSLKHVLTSAIFWVVAISHSGSSVVLSSARILGTYFQDTSYETISESQAGSVTIFLSLGTLMGLAVGGNIFTTLKNQKEKRDLVFKMYIMAIVMCYTLAFLAIPLVRKNIFHSPVIVATLQAIVTLFMGAGVAVQAYCIPAIVGATFGKNKALYAAYTDGVAYGVSSIVWKIVAGAVEEGHPEASGWAYGWAAVALLIILTSALMVTFMDHYFIKNDKKGHKSIFSVENIYPGSLTSYKDNKSSFVTDENSLNRNAIKKDSGTVLRRKDPSFFNKISSPGSLLGLESKDKHMGNNETKDDESTIIFEDISTDPLPTDGSTFGKVPDFMMKGVGTADHKNERILARLEKQENEVCVDCSACLPRWVSIVVPRYNTNKTSNSMLSVSSMTSPLGCFCCTECAAAHRKLGTHIVFVRSIDHDVFKEHEIVALENGGNDAVNHIFEARLSSIERELKKPNHKSDMNKRLDFVKLKYEHRQWFSVISFGSKSLLDEHVENAIPSLQDDLTSVSSRASFDSDDSNLMNAIELVPSNVPMSNVEIPKFSSFSKKSSFSINDSFQVGMKVYYQKTIHSSSEIVTVIAIHQDDPNSAYYTVRFQDGHERQTEEDKLSHVQNSLPQDFVPHNVTILPPIDHELSSSEYSVNNSLEKTSLRDQIFGQTNLFDKKTEDIYESFLEDDTGSQSDIGLINFDGTKTKDENSGTWSNEDRFPYDSDGNFDVIDL